MEWFHSHLLCVIVITVKKSFDDIIKNGPFPIRFPQAGELEQDQEWCEVQINGQWKKIRFHDYHEIYEIPGLYETLFYRTLGTNSPYRMGKFLSEILIEKKMNPSELKVLDFGAGNGMSGLALQDIGVRAIVGCDLLEEAKKANWRDRPWVYTDYICGDITKLKTKDYDTLKKYQFNTLFTVAALGFGDIPVDAFKVAYNLIAQDGFIVFNIRDQFLKDSYQSPFSKLIQEMIKNEVIELELYRRYQHRFNVHGEALYYVAIIATKKKNL